MDKEEEFLNDEDEVSDYGNSDDEDPVDSDSISPEEEAFLKGYDEANDEDID